ncbi:hypothetical protein FRC12_004855 [Ceratobasidium sp. 428]|nr:hypothetical protein FRC12_004855 [Ceratobasidium sp. 428]
MPTASSSSSRKTRMVAHPYAVDDSLLFRILSTTAKRMEMGYFLRAWSITLGLCLRSRPSRGSPHRGLPNQDSVARPQINSTTNPPSRGQRATTNFTINLGVLGFTASGSVSSHASASVDLAPTPVFITASAVRLEQLEPDRVGHSDSTTR